MSNSKKINLILAIAFFGIGIFEIIVFRDIITQPYMVFLLIFLGCVFGYNLGMFFNRK